MTNSDGGGAERVQSGQYALANVLFTRVPNELVGGELIWGRRTNNSDGFHSDGVHLQFWFKYSFSLKLGGQSWLEMKTLASAGRLAVAALGAAAAIGAQSAGSQQAVEQQQGVNTGRKHVAV